MEGLRGGVNLRTPPGRSSSKGMQRRPVLLGLAILTLVAGGQARAAAPPVSAPPVAALAPGATPLQVIERLGDPAVASREGRGALWTYRLEGCALMVFFKDEGQGLRVSGVTASARRRGEPTPDAAACVAGRRP